MYRRITAKMQEGNIMLARLQFVMSVTCLCTPLLTKFPSERTSIHLLLEELAQVLQLLLQWFVKLDALKDKMLHSCSLFSLTTDLWVVGSMWVWRTNNWSSKETAGR